MILEFYIKRNHGDLYLPEGREGVGNSEYVRLLGDSHPAVAVNELARGGKWGRIVRRRDRHECLLSFV